MSTTTQRPTPETENNLFEITTRDMLGRPTGTKEYTHADFARNLELERDEAREQLESILNVIPADAPCLHAETGEAVADYILDLQKEVGRVHALYFNDKQQLEAMREAIKEAHEAIKLLRDAAPCPHPQEHPSLFAASKVADDTMRKLQPFLKP